MYIIGASGHAKVIIEILEDAGVQVKGVFDDDPRRIQVLSYKITGRLSELPSDQPCIIAIGDNQVRRKICEMLNTKYGIAKHPSGILSKTSSIGEGTVVMANVVVNADTVIGKHCILNTSASIDHDCVIEDYVHISPNATLAGGVSVGEGTHIGAGAILIPGVKVGKWAKIGAGAVVIRDIPDYAVAVGNPAKTIKYNTLA